MQMTAESSAGAASHIPTDWHAIPWKKVNEHVRRLQARIVQAMKAGKWHKVQALQHLLTHSLSGKALAVRRVTENQGKNTPGVDKVTWKDPEEKWMAIHLMQQRGYKARPLRRVYIPKSNGKKRPLGIPTMQDRAMQALYLHALDPIAETLADPNSYGFRKERSCADAMEQCATVLSNSTRPQWILEGDIKSCFDKISHSWLLSHIPMDKTFLITGISKEVLEQEVKPLVTDFLRERGLELSEEKTTITHIEDGFDFLGQHVRKYNGHFLTRPAKKNVKAFLTDIRKVIKDKKAATAYGLIATLNPKIRGWANFHRHAAAKKTFVHVDTAIFNALWRWTRRRHPKKGKRWVKDRYFGRVGNQNWRFFGTAKDKDGKPTRNLLCLASAIPITRYTKIKGDCNPYDPTWEIYLEKRLGVKMEQTLRGRRRLLYLWKEQDGLCPVCHQPITHVTGWHNHHVVYKTLGGTDSAENRVLIHPNCHKQVHAKGLTVSKPRPAKAGPQAQPGALLH